MSHFFLKVFIWNLKILKTELILTHLKINNMIRKDGGKSGVTTSNNKVSTNFKDCDKHISTKQYVLLTLEFTHEKSQHFFLFYSNFKPMAVKQVSLANPEFN